MVPGTTKLKTWLFGFEDGNRTPDWSESATERVLTAIADTTNEWLISDISGIRVEYLLVRLDHHIG